MGQVRRLMVRLENGPPESTLDTLEIGPPESTFGVYRLAFRVSRWTAVTAGYGGNIQTVDARRSSTDSRNASPPLIR